MLSICRLYQFTRTMCFLWTLALLTSAVEISITEIMTVGDAPLTTDAPVEFDFQEPNGWLRVDLDYLLPNLSVAIGIRDSEDAEWTWSHLKRTDGVITTGKAKFAKVKEKITPLSQKKLVSGSSL